jgi:hypothetical protein
MNLIRYEKGVLTLKLPISLMIKFSALSIMFILFFVGGPGYYSSPVYKEFWNIGHIVFFSLSTYTLISPLKRKSLFVITLISFLYCIILGGAIELLQSKIGRSADMHDLYRDGLGGFLALSIYIYQQKQQIKLQYVKNILVFISVLLVCIDQIKLYNVIKIDIDARSNFPYLSDFENPNELKQWSGKSLNLSSKYVLTGLYSMEVKLSSKTKHSGFSLKHMPSDWEGYTYLLINIYNPNQETFKISTRITDFDHDLNSQSYNNRYNKHFILEANQWNNIKIKLEDIKNSPKNRKLDLSNMSQLGLFTSGLKSDKTIYLDGITLL